MRTVWPVLKNEEKTAAMAEGGGEQTAFFALPLAAYFDALAERLHRAPIHTFDSDAGCFELRQHLLGAGWLR